MSTIAQPSAVPLANLKPGTQPRDAASAARQVAFLTACFRDLGERQLVPIIATSGGEIIDGHCRHAALSAAGRKSARVVAWWGKTAPTPEEIAAINATQAKIEPATATLERWASLIRDHGWTVETLADATGKSPEKLGREVSAWLRIPEPVRADLTAKGASKAAIVEAGKAATKAKAGTVDSQGRTRKGKGAPSIRPPPVELKAGGGEGVPTPPEADLAAPLVAAFYALPTDKRGLLDDPHNAGFLALNIPDHLAQRIAKAWGNTEAGILAGLSKVLK